MTPQSFRPLPLETLERALRPLSLLASPVPLGLERVPRHGPVLFVGNHTIYGGLDLAMLGLVIFAETGRWLRGLADHLHYQIPGWRDLLTRLGAVHGTRENCARLFAQGEAVAVFPGGGREVNRRRGEAYRLLWKRRIGFARMAIAHGVPVVPFTSLGVDDMFDVLLDVDDVLASPVGSLLRRLGVTEQAWFRGGDAIPSLSRGRGPLGIPRFERQYFHFGEPIDTAEWAGRHDDDEACWELRKQVEREIEMGVGLLAEIRDRDPERYPVQRLLRNLAARLG